MLQINVAVDSTRVCFRQRALLASECLHMLEALPAAASIIALILTPYLRAKNWMLLDLVEAVFITILPSQQIPMLETPAMLPVSDHE